MAANTQQILAQIQEILNENITGGKISVAENGLNFSVPMQFGDAKEPSPINFACRVNENYVETFCVMTHEFFDKPAGVEPPQDFYKLMNAINMRNKGTCVYFFTEDALVCSSVAPCPIEFSKESYWFNTFNLIDTIAKFTPSFYGVMNNQVSLETLLQVYKENNM